MQEHRSRLYARDGRCIKTMPSRVRAPKGSTEGSTRATHERRDPAIKPPVSPVHQPKAIGLAIIARSLDQTLATPTLEAPEAGERRMKGELHLILQVEIGSWQQLDNPLHSLPRFMYANNN